MVSYYKAIAHAEGTITLTHNILGIQIMNGHVALCDIVIIHPQGEIVKYVFSCGACQILNQYLYTLSKCFSEINFEIRRFFFFLKQEHSRDAEHCSR